MKIIPFTCLFVILSLFACKKEGCTDENATNPTAGADKDDGSCTYQSTVVFWHNNTTKSIINSHGTSSLTYYLDGTQLGSSDPNVVFDSAPDCSESTAFVRSVAYDEGSTKNLNFEVKSQTGQLEFSGTISFVHGECISQELAY